MKTLFTIGRELVKLCIFDIALKPFKNLRVYCFCNDTSEKITVVIPTTLNIQLRMK